MSINKKISFSINDDSENYNFNKFEYETQPIK